MQSVGKELESLVSSSDLILFFNDALFHQRLIKDDRVKYCALPPTFI